MRSPSAKARCSRPSTSPSKLKTRAFVAYPSANRRGSSTCVRIVAVGGRSVIRCLAQPSSNRDERAYRRSTTSPSLLNVDELRPTGRVPGEDAVAHEPGSLGVADEDRRDGQLQLVDEVLGEELRVNGAAALDHQPVDASRSKVGAERPHLHVVAARRRRSRPARDDPARPPPAGSRSRRSSRCHRP